METLPADIRSAIKDVLDDLTTIDKVYDHEVSTFEGFPAVIIASTDNEADYSSTQDDRLTFVYKLRVYYPVVKESDYAAAEGFMDAAWGEMLVAFKARNCLGTACDWVRPVPSIRYFEWIGEAVYRVSEMTLRCVKYAPNT